MGKVIRGDQSAALGDGRFSPLDRADFAVHISKSTRLHCSITLLDLIDRIRTNHVIHWKTRRFGRKIFVFVVALEFRRVSLSGDRSEK